MCFAVQDSFAADLAVLKPAAFAHYIEHFNAMEDENVTNFISNAGSWDWLQKEIPFFECPDREVEEMYYFRWWSFRKHLEQTTERICVHGISHPRHARSAARSAINSPKAAGCTTRIISMTTSATGCATPTSRQQLHKYSSWLADALYQRYLVTGDKKFLVSLLDDLTRDYRQWEAGAA